MAILVKHIEAFLRQLQLDKTPFLLALSGGPDSICLFHCLLECQKKKPFHFEVIHIDHGWRKESREQALELKKRVEQEGIRFHLRTLKPVSKGNLEAICREERLQAFQAICQERGLHHVLLAHQADDQAETVLKRILEGAHWSRLAGLQAEIKMGGLSLLRPFLKISKTTILGWLGEKGIPYFNDATNQNPRFMRARMRESIIPALSETFGKGIVAPLQAIGEDLQELREFFEERHAPLLKNVKRGPFGCYLDLQEGCPNTLIALKFLVRQFSEESNFSLSRPSLQSVAEWLQQRVANKRIGDLWVDRGRLFIFKNPPGGWQVEWGESTNVQTTSWKEGWMGECQVVLPKKEYRLGPPNLKAPFRRGVDLDKWWNTHKVPAFLRPLFPVIWDGETMIHEFLTGTNYSEDGKIEKILIKLRLG